MLLVVVFSAAPATAQVTMWQGGGATDNWSDGSNWDSGPPQNGWDVLFMPVPTPSFMDIPGLILNQLDMTGYSGVLMLQQDLGVTMDALLDGNVVLGGWSLSGASMVQVLATGGVDISTGNLAVGGDLLVEGSLTSTSSAAIDVGGMLVALPTAAISLLSTTYTTVMGDVDLLAAGFVDLPGCTFDLQGAGQNVLLPPAKSLQKLYVNQSTASDVVTITAGGVTTLLSDLVVNRGILRVDGVDLTVLGHTNVMALGSLRNDDGPGRTYRFLQDMDIYGQFRFLGDNLTIKFNDGLVIDVYALAEFRIDGGISNRITVQNDQNLTQWYLSADPSATVYIRDANISWCYYATSLFVHSCGDMGNNTGLIFIEPDIDLSTTLLDYYFVKVGTTKYDTVTVYNVGTDTLNVTSVYTTDPVYVPTPTAFMLLPADSQKVSVAFTPTTTNLYLKDMWIASDDPDELLERVRTNGAGALPNLTFFSFTTPAELTEGDEPIDAILTVDNIGNWEAGPFRVSLRLSPDVAITTDDDILATFDVSGLPAGVDTTANLTVTIPALAPRGDIYLGAIADDLDQVVEANEANNTAVHAFSYQVPLVHSVMDVPLDQGGQVFLSWYASPLDPPGGISEYTLWRTIDVPLAQAVVKSGTVIRSASEWSTQLEKPVIRAGASPAGPVFWEHIATHGAFRRDAYGMALPTLFDSTTAGYQYHYFQVIAHTSAPDTFYISATDSGYSVDDLAPAAPLNLAGEQTEANGLQLTWDPNSETDLSHYAVYRGTDAGFTPDEGNLVDETTDTGLFDDGWRWDGGYHYKVAAVDIHGNVSLYAAFGSDEVVGTDGAGPPAANYLGQNRPNPFGTDTRIAYGLSGDADVSIRIYDVKGRLVRTVVNGRRTADHHSAVWDGRDDAGRMVSGGVYFYRITAGSFVQTRKMVILR